MHWFPGFPALLACLVAASVLVLGTEARAVVFDDGQVHVIDANNSFPAEGVEVFDSPGGAPTKLFVVTGGLVGGKINVLDSSTVNVSGGEMGQVVARDSASIVFSGGNAGSVVALDQGSLTVTGGSGASVGASQGGNAEIFP